MTWSCKCTSNFY